MITQGRGPREQCLVFPWKIQVCQSVLNTGPVLITVWKTRVPGVWKIWGPRENTGSCFFTQEKELVPLL